MPEIPLTLVHVTAAEAAEAVRDHHVDAVLLRSSTKPSGLHAIPLYTETTVVVVPKDHLVAAADVVSTGDLADDIVLHPLDDTLDWVRPPGQPAITRPATTGAAIELVAAGVGLLVVPQSLARLHHRKDLTYRPVTEAPQSRVALCWLEDNTTDVIDTFIGIVRGRTPNSTRGRVAPPKAETAKQPEAGRKAKPATGGNRRRSPRPAHNNRRKKPRRRS